VADTTAQTLVEQLVGKFEGEAFFCFEKLLIATLIGSPTSNKKNYSNSLVGAGNFDFLAF
jgi:hypothetical protein